MHNKTLYGAETLLIFLSVISFKYPPARLLFANTSVMICVGEMYLCNKQ